MSKNHRIPKRRKPAESPTWGINDKVRVVACPNAKSSIRVQVEQPDGSVVTRQMTVDEISQVIAETPQKLRHESMEPEDEAITRYTYRRVGYLLHPTFEQWERGFLMDRNMERELMFWLHVVAFMDHFDIQGEGQRRATISALCAGNLSGEVASRWQAFREEEGIDRWIEEAFDEFDL